MTRPFKVGVVHGRFQPFHNDHLKFILGAFERADMMYVGITNPDPNLTADDKADSNRSKHFANPYTYFERVEMLFRALPQAGIDPKRFRIVPFPINYPQLLANYCPADAVFFHTIYDAWGDRKKELMESVGLNVEVLWKKPESEKGINASQIRNKIVANEPWEDMVPQAVADYMKSAGLDSRIREIYKKQ